MIGLDETLRELKTMQGDATYRLQCEMKFAKQVSAVLGGRYDALLASVADSALAFQRENGAITLPFVQSVEQRLSPMASECKKYTWLMVGHAHIDMNWLWAYEETVVVVLDTFRTMLTLMKEFPDFTFAQSQASTYAIVAEHDPAMLEEIKARIRAGNWEVTASGWVEPDHNMLSLESELRHLLYTKRYLSKLLDIPAERLNLDFVPDTFGHNERLPDVMNFGGVRYMYHCRGENARSLYRWQGKTGEVVAFCDPEWYNIQVDGMIAESIPGFSRDFHVPAMLTVYGVGDHGGGPTRKDLRRIVDMMDWPIFPEVRFGTYQEFFTLCEKSKQYLPVVQGERNSIFTGCYTSQTAIKQGNAKAEALLYEAELFSALAHVKTGSFYRAQINENAWRKTLFNHFHDILPGSGVTATRDYALGAYQAVFATAMAERRSAYAAIASAIDTSGLTRLIPPGDTIFGESEALGAAEGRHSGVCDATGGARIFHIFNALPYDRAGLAQVMVWDYPADISLMEFLDDQGRVLAHQTISTGGYPFSVHTLTRVLVEVAAPACGYATVVLRKKQEREIPPSRHQTYPDLRVESAFHMSLENDRLLAAFDPVTLRLISLTDKATGEIKALDAGFDLIEEDPSRGMTAWRIGRYMNVQNAGHRAVAKKTITGTLRNAYEVTLDVGGSSTLNYTVSLDKDADHLAYSVSCDWREMGTPKIIPQLSFSVKCAKPSAAFDYRVAGGLVQRPGKNQDAPSLGLIRGGDIALLCDSRYGFRGEGDTMRMAIVRSSIDPDGIPEARNNTCRLSLGLSGETDGALLAKADALTHPFDVVSGSIHGGSMPLNAALLRLAGGGAQLSGVKMAEDEEAMTLHVHSISDKPEKIDLIFPMDVESASMSDALENTRPGACEIEGERVTLSLAPHAMVSVKARFV